MKAAETEKTVMKSVTTDHISLARRTKSRKKMTKLIKCINKMLGRPRATGSINGMGTEIADAMTKIGLRRRNNTGDLHVETRKFAEVVNVVQWIPITLTLKFLTPSIHPITLEE